MQAAVCPNCDTSLPRAVAESILSLPIGTVAMRTGPSTAYVGWRLLGTDAENIGFNVLQALTEAAHAEKPGSLVVGEIPNYALMPDGALCSTTYFHRQL